MDRLAEIALAVERDPGQAARDAGELGDQASADGDWATAGQAHAIRGRALRMLGEIGLAEHALRRAVAAAAHHGDADLEADAHLALAGVLSAAGRHGEAFRSLDAADRVATGPARERVRLQRAVVCRDVGRHDEALRLFGDALPGLRAADRDLDIARVLANRGGILIHQGRVDDAIADYEEAAALFRSIDLQFIAYQVLHDLGCAAAHTGDLARALRLFDEASTGMAALGHDASVPVLSRAEALLRAGLSADALDFAHDAARRLAAEGNAFASAQALLAVAEASRLEDDADGALAAAERAAAGFAEGGAAGWERAATVEAIRIRIGVGDVRPADIDRLSAVAADLAEAGDLRNEVEARCLAAVGASALHMTERADAEIAAAAVVVRRTRLARQQASLHHARAAARFASGDAAGTGRSLRAAFDALSVAARLSGTSEANVALGTEGRAIGDLAMRVAVGEPRALQTLVWMERVRAAAAPPLAHRHGAAGAAEFAHLRAITGALRRAERDGEPTEELRRRQTALEASMRAGWMRDAPSAPEAGHDTRPPAFRAGALRDVIGDTAVVSIGFGAGRAVAVVAYGSRTRRIDLGPSGALIEAAERAIATLRGAAAAGPATVAAARVRAFAAAVADLDRIVLVPLDLPVAPVALVVPAALHAVPWAATPTLVRSPFTLAPSVAWWVDAIARPSRRDTALVVAGPRVAGSAAEAGGVAACHPGATRLVGSAATVDATLGAMGRHDIVHIVAHGRFRRDNPLWSTIELADGPMSVYELQGLERAPATVVVATCESGVAGGRAAAQVQGIATSLLRMGARTVVASNGALPDGERTIDTMIGLHRDLHAGIGPAVSLAARRSMRLDDTMDVDADVTAASLVTVGVGGA